MIRAYEPADCEDVLNVWAGASKVAHSFLSEEFMERERERIPSVYLPNAETWVYEASGRVVGFIALLGNEVGALFVGPRHQRTGIGQALLEHARDLRGDLEVEVFTQNRRGRAFYAKHGFELMRHEIHEETGFELMRLRLPGAAQEVE